MLPLSDIRVLDFGTLLPGPLATLILAEAGAEILKIERPGQGDEMRSYEPKLGVDSANFALLNRGKRSIAVNLKGPDAFALLKPLIAEADILLEQFRPGVMERLGFGYEAVKAVNPAIIYVSITGYGQDGPLRDVVGHDLNYMAQSGLLSLSADCTGSPVLPPALVADIAGGAYPAVMNILMALRKRDRSGEGAWLDISMADNLFVLQYWALANGLAGSQWPNPGGELVTGGSPRYNIYRTADGRFLAAAPLEDRFWERFCSLLSISISNVQEIAEPAQAVETVAEAVRSKTSAELLALFKGQDVCCNICQSLREALDDRHFQARALFDRSVLAAHGAALQALPVPICATLRDTVKAKASPELGSGNAAFNIPYE